VLCGPPQQPQQGKVSPGLAFFIISPRFISIEQKEFILSLEKPTITKILRTVGLLERFSFNLGMPHSKKVMGVLFELRVREIKKAYKDLGPEFAVVEMIIAKRLKAGLTQTEFAKKAKTLQLVISRLERGDFSPTLQFLYHLTDALDAKLRILIS